MSRRVDIVIRNVYCLLRCGALDVLGTFELMSPYKWRRAGEIVVGAGVSEVAWRAVQNHQYESSFNMPSDVRELLQRESQKTVSKNIDLSMHNAVLNKKLKRIILAEQSAESYSKESLELLGILLANCQLLLTEGPSVRLILRLCNYIHTHRETVDYAKVCHWLRELQMQRVACLVGSILIDHFAFKKSELPFVTQVDNKASAMLTAGLLQSTSSWQSRGFTYFGYAPLENASIIMQSLKSRLDQIEE